MSNRVAPECRRFRPFIIVCLPVLFIACLFAATWVLIATKNVWLAAPLFAVSLAPMRLMRWSMVWMSTPDEKKIFASALEQEPVMGLLKEIVKKWRAN